MSDQMDRTSPDSESTTLTPSPLERKRWFKSQLLPTWIMVFAVSGFSYWNTTTARKIAETADRNATTAEKALGVSQATSKLNLVPELRIDHRLGDQNPSLVIVNVGPVSATHVTLQLVHLGYDPVRKRIRIATYETLQSFYFPSLQPDAMEVMRFNRQVLRQFLLGYVDPLADEKQPYYDDVLEIRVRYHREADNAAFARRVFYFRSDEGWARENQSSFPRDVLQAAMASKLPLLKPLFAMYPWTEE